MFPFIIPSHTVYATSMERLIATYTETSQEEMIGREALLRHENVQTQRKRKLEVENLYHDLGNS